MSGGAGFGALDWVVVALYVMGVIAVGVASARRQRSTEDYFLAGRRMPVLAVAASIIATALSAATFIGGPQKGYASNLTYLSASIGAMLGVVVVAFAFLPAYYRHGVTTVYGLLGDRFGPGARRSASGMFMVGRVMASGARLFIVALPVSLIVFGDDSPPHMLAAIAIVATAAVAYTAVGGIAAVIWTDVAQLVVLLGAAIVACFVLLDRIPIGVGEILGELADGTLADGTRKLTVIDTSGDPGRTFTIWTAVIGFTLFNMAAYGTDQDLAQRMLTCKSAARSAWSVILSQVLGVGTTVVFLSLGLLLWVYYDRPDIMGVAAPVPPDGSRLVFLEFILRDMPPVIRGLAVAGLFAAAMSSLDSALNALASTTMCDFRGRESVPARGLKGARLAVAVWGVVLAGFAAVCVPWQASGGTHLIDFALGVMVYAYAGLLGVFITALFTRRGNEGSVLAALVVGVLTVAALEFGPVLAARVAPGWVESVLARTGWAELRVSLGWRMVIGTGVSLLVCASGEPHRRVPGG